MKKLEKLKDIPNPAWYSMTIAFLTLSICGIIIISVLWYFANQLIYSYGIIIDAGSTSTKMFLFKWPEIASRTNGEVSQVKMCKSAPGISDFMNDPSGSVDGIEMCLNDEMMPLIPQRLRTKSFVYLGATAGMRIIEYRSPKAMRLIFEAVERFLLTTGLKMKDGLRDVKVISGSVEGLAAWITTNYLKKTLQDDKVTSVFTKKKETFGALDLGGASTQITFVTNKTIDFGNNLVRLYGENYNVYSHSYLCYGKSQAEFRFLALLSQTWIANYKSNQPLSTINNPCMLKGDSASYILQDIITIPCVSGNYSKQNFGFSIELPEFMKNIVLNVTYIGTGDPDLCHNAVKKLFSRSNCAHKNCGFNNVYQPNITGKYIAFAGYALVYKQLTKFFKSSPKDYYDFLLKSKDYCSRNAPQVLTPTTQKEQELENWRKWRCFGFLYVFELLNNLGFNNMNWDSITFSNTINNANLGWSLGYMINKTAMIPIEKPLVTMSLGTFVAILITFLVMFSIGCLFAIISYKLHWLKSVTEKSSEVVSLNPKVNNISDDSANKV